MDANLNGIPDKVEIAAAEAKSHEADAQKAEAETRRAQVELEKARLPYQVPLYDRIVMRLAVPFALAFAAPIATYYFGSKASHGLESVERLEKTVERLERLAVESELRVRLHNVAPVQSNGQGDVPIGTTAVSEQQRIDQIAEDYLKQVQQEPRLDKFLRGRDQDQNQRQLQDQREGR